MARPTKRRRPAAKRPPAGHGTSRLGSSGWVVAACIGAVWAFPHVAGWRSPTTGPREHETRRTVVEKAVPVERSSARPDVAPAPAKRMAAVEVVPEARPKPPAALKPERLLSPARSEAPGLLPPVRMLTMDAGKPMPTRIASTERPSPPVRATTQPTPSRQGMPIRKFPYVTAETVASVADLRTIQIVGGQGDWKKVKLAGSGQVGWLQLRRYTPPTK